MIGFISAEQTHSLRKRILRKGITNPDVCFDCDSKDSTFHIGILKKESFIAVATFTENKKITADLFDEIIDSKEKPHPIYQLRGMAVEEKYQGMGLGSQLLRFAEQELHNRKATIVWCNARKGAIPFYEKQGYEAWSHFFEVPSIGPHLVMGKRLY